MPVSFFIPTRQAKTATPRSLVIAIGFFFVVSDREHLRQWQQQLTHAEQKLNTLAAITLTLTADEVAS
ncbi:hypothetical protein AB9D72_16580, partial [Escherichia coli]